MKEKIRYILAELVNRERKRKRNNTIEVIGNIHDNSELLEDGE